MPTLDPVVLFFLLRRSRGRHGARTASGRTRLRHHHGAKGHNYENYAMIPFLSDGGDAGGPKSSNGETMYPLKPMTPEYPVPLDPACRRKL